MPFKNLKAAMSKRPGVRLRGFPVFVIENWDCTIGRTIGDSQLRRRKS